MSNLLEKSTVSSGWGDRALCIATMLFAAAATLLTRWLNLADELWLDELHSSWVVTDSFADIVPRAGIGNQTPLWFWLTWPIYHGLGPSEFSLRLLSWLASAALAAVAVEMVWRWRPAGGASPWMTALAVAGLIVFDPTFIFYGSEARPYACLQLVAALRLRTLWSLTDGAGRGVRVAHVVLGVVMLWLHLTGGLILAGEWAAHAVWRAEGRRGYRWRDAALDTTLVLASLVPLAWLLGLVFHRRQNWTFVPELSLEGFGELIRAWPLLAPAVGITLAAWAVDWLCSPLVATPQRNIPQNPWDDPEPEPTVEREPAIERLRKGLQASLWPGLPLAAAPVAWTLATLAAAALSQGLGFAPLFFGRYLIGVSVGGMLATAVLACGFKSWPARWGAAAVLVFAFTHTTGMFDPTLKNLDVLIGVAQRSTEPLVKERQDQYWPKSNWSRPVVLVRQNLVEDATPDDWPTSLREEYDTFVFRGLYRPTSRDKLFTLNPDWPEKSSEITSDPRAIEAIVSTGSGRVFVMGRPIVSGRVFALGAAIGFDSASGSIAGIECEMPVVGATSRYQEYEIDALTITKLREQRVGRRDSNGDGPQAIGDP